LAESPASLLERAINANHDALCMFETFSEPGQRLSPHWLLMNTACRIRALPYYTLQSAVQPSVRPAVRLRGFDEIEERIYAAISFETLRQFWNRGQSPRGYFRIGLAETESIFKIIIRIVCVDSQRY
jgi:hypothetical protein